MDVLLLVGKTVFLLLHNICTLFQLFQIQIILSFQLPRQLLNLSPQFGKFFFVLQNGSFRRSDCLTHGFTPLYKRILFCDSCILTGIGQLSPECSQLLFLLFQRGFVSAHAVSDFPNLVVRISPDFLLSGNQALLQLLMARLVLTLHRDLFLQALNVSFHHFRLSLNKLRSMIQSVTSKQCGCLCQNLCFSFLKSGCQLSGCSAGLFSSLSCRFHSLMAGIQLFPGGSLCGLNRRRRVVNRTTDRASYAIFQCLCQNARLLVQICSVLLVIAALRFFIGLIIPFVLILSFQQRTLFLI